MIQPNKASRRKAWSKLSEADRSLWDQPSILGASPKSVVSLSDVMFDDTGQVVSLAEHPIDDLPEPLLLACLTDRPDNDTIPPEVLVRMTSNAINRHVKYDQGSARTTNAAIRKPSHSLVTDSVSRSVHISTSGGVALADGGVQSSIGRQQDACCSS